MAAVAGAIEGQMLRVGEWQDRAPIERRARPDRATSSARSATWRLVRSLTPLGGRRANLTAPGLRARPARPQADPDDVRLGQEDRRHPMGSAARAGPGRMALHAARGRRQPRPAAEAFRLGNRIGLLTLLAIRIAPQPRRHTRLRSAVTASSVFSTSPASL
jgi:hypothetical protein